LPVKIAELKLFKNYLLYFKDVLKVAPTVKIGIVGKYTEY